ERQLPLYSPEGFAVIADLYVTVGWNEKYSYGFTWLGRPIIQLPDDMVRLQEVIYAVKPALIIETAVAHGGSLIFSASLCKLIGKGRVIGVDIEIRPKNRAAIEKHDLSHMITLIEGNSIGESVLEQLREAIGSEAPVLVILDSNHSYDHVQAELKAYSEFVTTGSYIVATDGVMRSLSDVPRGEPGWALDNPARAAEDFAQVDSRFVLAPPQYVFNETKIVDPNLVTHWPSAYLRKV
ncbi:MAG: cephalosporin hydroxylase family protein, partial [Hyphomicrobiaceae bacterium]|nr:cephalosporin hydroxylase family protein [Hyphomicrobiaceae bacterium]